MDVRRTHPHCRALALRQGHRARASAEMAAFRKELDRKHEGSVGLNMQSSKEAGPGQNIQQVWDLTVKPNVPVSKSCELSSHRHGVIARPQTH